MKRAPLPPSDDPFAFYHFSIGEIAIEISLEGDSLITRDKFFRLFDHN